MSLRPAASALRIRVSTPLTSGPTTSSILRPATAALTSSSSSRPAFSTSTPHHGEKQGSKTKDRSKMRGVSALRRKYPKEPLEMSKVPLPKPVLDPSKHTKVETDPDHGLWGFFDDKKALRSPEEDAAYGREWMPSELRLKSFEDLHKLWYVCVRERNRIATYRAEHKRLEAGYGARESEARDRTVRLTMKAIKHVLTERVYAWQEARQVAMEDPEVDLSGTGPAYVPGRGSENAPVLESEGVAAEEVPRPGDAEVIPEPVKSEGSRVSV